MCVRAGLLNRGGSLTLIEELNVLINAFQIGTRPNCCADSLETQEGGGGINPRENTLKAFVLCVT